MEVSKVKLSYNVTITKVPLEGEGISCEPLSTYRSKANIVKGPVQVVGSIAGSSHQDYQPGGSYKEKIEDTFMYGNSNDNLAVSEAGISARMYIQAKSVSVLLKVCGKFRNNPTRGRMFFFKILSICLA